MQIKPPHVSPGALPLAEDYNSLLDEAFKIDPAPVLPTIGDGDPAPVRFNCILVDAVDGGAGPFDVDNVEMISGANPTASTSEIVQVYNPIGFFGDIGGAAKASWCDDAERYEFDIIACPA